MQNKATASIKQIAAGELSLSGSLNFMSVVALQAEGETLITQQGTDECVIDLSAVTESSSVGVALLTVWLRFAQSHHKTLRYSHLPKAMLDMVQLSGLDHLLLA